MRTERLIAFLEHRRFSESRTRTCKIRRLLKGEIAHRRRLEPGPDTTAFRGSSPVTTQYGHEPELRLAIERYGSQVIPVVAHFLESGSAYYQGKQAISDAVSRWRAGEGMGW